MLQRWVESALTTTVAVKHQSSLLVRIPLEPCHAQCINDDVARHVVSQRPAHHLATQQANHYGQKQPDFARCGRNELPVEQVGRDRQIMIAVPGDLEAPLSPGMSAVQLRSLLHALLAYTSPANPQFLPVARPAITASRFGMDGLDVQQQRVISQMAALAKRTKCL